MADFNPMEVAKAETRGVNDTGRQLLDFLERVERLEEERKTLADDIKDVKTEVKSAGYDITTFNEMLKLRKLDKAEREEREHLRDTYGHAIGIFG